MHLRQAAERHLQLVPFLLGVNEDGIDHRLRGIGIGKPIGHALRTSVGRRYSGRRSFKLSTNYLAALVANNFDFPRTT